ncbi:ABC transporter permease [Actinoplanes sp. GCM10030250]|uniref:ABC transporter permease n=1 Tax=Actinoplanes sp. GCM10030250 TaxID=3273376 RepID=UPI00362156DC
MPGPRMAVVRAEWTKLWTVPGTLLLLIVAAATTVAVAVLAVATETCPEPECGVAAMLTGVRLGQAVIAIVAVLMISDEYRTGLIRLTFAAVPNRSGVLAAKAGVLTVVLTVTAAVAVLGSLLGGRLVLPGRGYAAPSLADGEVARAVGGSVLYLVLIGLLGLGAGTLLRSPAGAIGTVLGLIYVVPIMAAAAPDPKWERRLQQIGPMDAGLAIQKTGDLAGLPVQPWHGLGVLVLWAAGALVLAGVLLHQRDA